MTTDTTIKQRAVPSVSVTYARNGVSTKANAFGMRPMQKSEPLKSAASSIY